MAPPIAGQTMPIDEDAIMELAKVAHLFWCGRMIRAGWKYGQMYDPTLRTHNALQPFDRLDLRDKRAARIILETEEFGERLAEVIEYPRGPDRPFIAEEMKIGLRVGWADHVRLADRDSQAQTGSIASWELDPHTKELTLLRVLWQPGNLTEHHPDEGDLVRLDPS